MLHRRRARARFSVLLCAGLILALPAAASASPGLSWSGPFPVGNGTPPVVDLSSVTCPGTTTCVLTGGDIMPPFGGGHGHDGIELTVNPLDPGTTPVAILRASAGGNDEKDLAGAQCPTVSTCFTAGVEFSPSNPAAHTTLGGVYISSCPTTSECVGFTPAGPNTPATVAAFDPASPAAQTVTTFPANFEPSTLALSCPSANQCTVVGDNVDPNAPQIAVDEATFDPAAGGTASLQSLGFSHPYSSSYLEINGYQCPTTSECLLYTVGKGLMNFNPTAPGGASFTQLGPISASTRITSLSCTSGTSCVARPSGETNQMIAFDPTAASAASLEQIPGAQELTGVGCASSSECVAVDFYRGLFVGLAPGSVRAGALSLGKLAASGNTVEVPVSCGKGGSCQIGLQLVTSIPNFDTAPVAFLDDKLAAGQSKTERITLAPLGQELLAKYHRASATLLVGEMGTSGAVTRTVELGGSPQTAGSSGKPPAKGNGSSGSHGKGKCRRGKKCSHR